MGLNIGDINFGMEAQTEGLQKAVNQLRQFQRTVDETAKAQTAGANAAAAAMGRQESAIKRGLLQVTNMRAELQRLGAAPAYLAPVTIAFQRLTKEMTSGRLSSTEYGRSMDAFNTRMNRVRSTLKDLKATEAKKHLGKLGEIMRDLESASVLAVGPLSGLGARIRALGAITSRSTIAIAALLAVITGFAVGMGKLATASVRAQQQFEQYSARISTVTHNTYLAGLEIDKLASLTSGLGLDLETSARAFSTLAASARGTALEGKGARDVFEGVATAAAALRLNNEQLQGSMRAIEQMLSKGTVQAEELRGQLGERLPGGFKLAAEAMGKTTSELNKMLQKGEVLATDLLPKLGKHLKETFGDQAAKNINSTQGAMNALTTATFQFNLAISNTAKTSDVYIGVLQFLAKALNFMTENMRTLLVVAGALAGAMLGFSGPAIVSGVIKLGRAIYTVAKSMTVLNAAMLANPATGLLAILVRVGAAAAGALLGFKLMEKGLGDISSETDDLVKEMEALIEVADKYGSILKEQQDDALERGTKRLEQLHDEEKAMQNLIVQHKEELKLARMTPTMAGMGPGMDMQIAALRGVGESEEGLKRVQEEIDKLTENMDKLSKVNVRDPTKDLNALAGDSKRERALERMIAKIKEMAAQLNDLQSITSNMPSTLQELDDAMSLKEAREELRDFNSGELQKILDVFKQLGYTESDATIAFAQLTSGLKEQTDAIKDHRAALEATPDILREYNLEMERLAAQVEALNTGSLAMEAFEADQQQAEAVRQMREELEKTNLTLEERNKLVEAYKLRLGEVRDAEESFSDASDRMASTLINGLEAITFGQKSLKETISDLEQAIVKLITQILVLEPLERQLRSAFEGNGMNAGVGGSSVGGGGAGFFSALFSSLFGMATGGVITSNGGGIDSQMVAFMKSPTEDIHVRRHSEGDASSGMSITNNFHVTAPGGNISQRTQQQMAAEMITAATRARRRNGQ